MHFNGLEVFAKCALYLNLVLIKLISNFTILFGAIDILIASTIIHEHINIQAMIIAQIAPTGGQKTEILTTNHPKTEILMAWKSVPSVLYI